MMNELVRDHHNCSRCRSRRRISYLADQPLFCMECDVMFTHQQKLDRVEKIIREKQLWISQFSSGRNKRPDHEIDNRQQDVNVLEEIAVDYRRAIARQAESEAA